MLFRILLSGCLGAIFTFSFAFAQSMDDLALLTEQYPPFNFKKDGQLQGISIDLLELMLKKAGSQLTRKDIQLLPWARAYKKTMENKNTVLFVTTRTKERENLFKWVGPITDTSIVLIAKKGDDIHINSLEEIKKYKIGVISEDVGEQLLVKDGIKDNLERVSKTILNIKKLNAGRIDAIAYAEKVAKWEIKANGFNPGDYETVYVLKKGQVYYALHKDTPDSVVEKLQSALGEIKREGKLQSILDKYTK